MRFLPGSGQAGRGGCALLYTQALRKGKLSSSAVMLLRRASCRYIGQSPPLAPGAEASSARSRAAVMAW